MQPSETVDIHFHLFTDLEYFFSTAESFFNFWRKICKMLIIFGFFVFFFRKRFRTLRIVKNSEAFILMRFFCARRLRASLSFIYFVFFLFLHQTDSPFYSKRRREDSHSTLAGYCAWESVVGQVIAHDLALRASFAKASVQPNSPSFQSLLSLPLPRAGLFLSLFLQVPRPLFEEAEEEKMLEKNGDNQPSEWGKGRRARKRGN